MLNTEYVCSPHKKTSITYLIAWIIHGGFGRMWMSFGKNSQNGLSFAMESQMEWNENFFAFAYSELVPRMFTALQTTVIQTMTDGEPMVNTAVEVFPTGWRSCWSVLSTQNFFRIEIDKRGLLDQMRIIGAYLNFRRFSQIDWSSFQRPHINNKTPLSLVVGFNSTQIHATHQFRAQNNVSQRYSMLTCVSSVICQNAVIKYWTFWKSKFQYLNAAIIANYIIIWVNFINFAAKMVLK